MIIFIFPSDRENQDFKKLRNYSGNHFYIHVFHESNFEEAIVFIYIRL